MKPPAFIPFLAAHQHPHSFPWLTDSKRSEMKGAVLPYISLFLCPHFQSKWLTVMILLKFWNVCVSRNGITIFLHRKSGLGWKSTALWAAHFLGTCFGGLSGLLLKADPLELRTCLAVWWEREKARQTGRHAVSLLRMRQGSSRLHFET